MSEAREKLLEALAFVVVAHQGRTNRERARLILAEIEGLGWRLEPPPSPEQTWNSVL